MVGAVTQRKALEHDPVGLQQIVTSLKPFVYGVVMAEPRVFALLRQWVQRHLISVVFSALAQPASVEHEAAFLTCDSVYMWAYGSWLLQPIDC